jgi:hypothetical protein
MPSPRSPWRGAVPDSSIVSGGAEPDARAQNYAGAVYGSLLAASVVAGTSPLQGTPTLSELVALLMITGLVFWLAHVYARLIGERVESGTPITRREIRRVAQHEWPLVESAIVPSVTACIAVLLGGSDLTAAWVALITAIIGQVGWAVVATVRSGAGMAIVVVSGIGNLILGATLVALKVALTH